MVRVKQTDTPALPPHPMGRLTSPPLLRFRVRDDVTLRARTSPVGVRASGAIRPHIRGGVQVVVPAE